MKKAQKQNTQNKNAAVASAVASNSAKVSTARAWSRHMVMGQLQMRGLDGACCWLGSEISDKFCNTLSESSAKLGAVKLGDKLGAVLVVEASRVFAWRVAVAGDVYARRDGILTVRGSLALLRDVYGAKNVSVVADAAAADKLAKGKKWDKGCRDALGLSDKLAK